jgi:soluble cytochrome b562
MSTDAGAGASEDLPPVTDYDGMLDTIDVAIDEAKRKIEEGRVRNPENEKVRVKQWRALGYLINIRRQVANDRDLEELASEVERLKAAHGDP